MNGVSELGFRQVVEHRDRFREPQLDIVASRPCVSSALKLAEMGMTTRMTFLGNIGLLRRPDLRHENTRLESELDRALGRRSGYQSAGDYEANAGNSTRMGVPWGLNGVLDLDGVFG